MRKPPAVQFLAPVTKKLFGRGLTLLFLRSVSPAKCHASGSELDEGEGEDLSSGSISPQTKPLLGGNQLACTEAHPWLASLSEQRTGRDHYGKILTVTVAGDLTTSPC